MLLALPLYAVWAGLDHIRGGRARLTRSQMRGLLVAGAFFAGDIAIWHVSIMLTSVANATLLANMAPVVVTLFAWLLFREHITRAFLGGMFLGLFGAVILVRGSFDLGAMTSQHLVGDALGLLTACFYGGYLLSVKNLRNSLPTGILMGISTLVTCLILFVVTLIMGQPIWPTTARGWLAVLGLAWTSQVVGQGLIAYGMAHLPASFSSVTLLIQPAGAALLAWMILGEDVSLWQALGGVGILAGIWLAGRASVGAAPGTPAGGAG
jgi:drug/metabolite transporter (DMT)-like permease